MIKSNLGRVSWTHSRKIHTYSIQILKLPQSGPRNFTHPPTKFSWGYPFLKTHSRIMIKADPSTCRENSIQGMVEGKSWWLYILDQYTRIQRSLNTPIQALCRVIFLNACMHMQNGSEKINLNWQEIPPPPSIGRLH